MEDKDTQITRIPTGVTTFRSTTILATPIIMWLHSAAAASTTEIRTHRTPTTRPARSVWISPPDRTRQSATEKTPTYGKKLAHTSHCLNKSHSKKF